MKEAVKELGKTFYTIAVVILGASIIHPIFSGKSILLINLSGFLFFLISLIIGFVLISLGEKLDK